VVRHIPDTETWDTGTLRQECRRLKIRADAQDEEIGLLRGRLARYETALRGSKVTVSTQDRDLRYTSISNPMLGQAIDTVLGRTDAEVFPFACGDTMADLKREALSTGRSVRAQVSFDYNNGLRWHDLHVEPLRNDGGDIVGVTCASIDVTERNENDAHLRMLLRELTHRSNNLLAVIQGMARQTARHAGSVGNFLNLFGARLQALAASHDLLVRESWYGASLGELVRSQLASNMERCPEQIAIDGPDVALKPEAAQNLGLALHELAVNAAKYGALSVPDGRLSITWKSRDGAGGGAVDLHWQEQFGPKVKGRRKKGFGSLVIERNLSRSLNADVAMEFEPNGLRCSIVIPVSQLLGVT
jgi:PAS domain S-box-containing protein